MTPAAVRARLRTERFLLTPAGRSTLRNWQQLRRERTGDTCVIMGNGPSLRNTDFDLLRDVPVFGLNKVHLLRSLTDLQPTYVVAVNPLVIEQSHRELRASPAALLVPTTAAGHFAERPRLCLLPPGADGTFAVSARCGFWEGYTVTYVALQVAYNLGFRKVVLIGVDHRFKAAESGQPNATVVAGDLDSDHFDPTYFSGGQLWHLPDLANSERAYRIARTRFERDGRIVVDATSHGALRVFPRAELAGALNAQ